ncbi:MAG TPA: thymidine phosphorylase [Polyangiaceae bacterium]|nr:thymidine phosphorylase [Polyangiaceae bacterium]
MTPVELIQKKRDGGALSAAEIGSFVTRFVAGEIADYQMSAMLMAMFLRGMSDEETVALMDCMLHSGKVLTLPGVTGPKIDKHSTGGVGDKVSICLAPLVAACGVFVPMVSGRGLGHTGGTVDKLQSIPGFRTDLDESEFERIVRDTGACLIGQTDEIAPADKRIYALRDVTGTVESIPLIVASILSKKLAEGIDGLVLDVKVGRGAFMKDAKSARKLAQALVRVGTRAGKKVVALLTAMQSPLGRCVGNALEIREAIEVLRGQGAADLVECTLALGREMLLLGRAAKTQREAEAKLVAAIRDGSAARTMERLIGAQGGDPRVVSDPSLLPTAPMATEVLAATRGFVTGIDALEIGLCAVAMGAGRLRAEQKIDPAVGIELLAKPGDAVARGAPLARLHLRTARPEIAERVARSFSVGPRPPPKKPLVIERITARGRG